MHLFNEQHSSSEIRVVRVVVASCPMAFYKAAGQHNSLPMVAECARAEYMAECMRTGRFDIMFEPFVYKTPMATTTRAATPTKIPKTPTTPNIKKVSVTPTKIPKTSCTPKSKKVSVTPTKIPNTSCTPKNKQAYASDTSEMAKKRVRIDTRIRRERWVGGPHRRSAQGRAGRSTAFKTVEPLRSFNFRLGLTPTKTPKTIAATPKKRARIPKSENAKRKSAK